MVKLNKIYTKTGDDGSTGLGDGSRRSKSDLRVTAYGTVDEANSVIGIARLHANESPIDLDDILQIIQNDLFDLGADLATPDSGKPLEFEPLRVVAAQVERLEQEIDLLNHNLEPLKSFVLPAGNALASHLHLARTIARRAERMVIALSEIESERVNPDAIRYLNRLSDYLFVAARTANGYGSKDVLWVPGKNR